MANLKNPKWMQATFCLYVRLVRFFFCFEGAKAMGLSVNGDMSRPPIPLLDDAKKPRCLIVSTGRSFVLPIFGVRCRPQVAESVVSANPINVIDLMAWPESRHIEPREPMGELWGSINVDLPITHAVHGAREKVIANAALFAASIPSEYTRRGVVTQKFAQTLRGKIGLSHEALLLLIGQRPASVGSAQRASLFSLFVHARASL